MSKTYSNRHHQTFCFTHTQPTKYSAYIAHLVEVLYDNRLKANRKKGCINCPLELWSGVLAWTFVRIMTLMKQSIGEIHFQV